jgi:hypothetical protein
MSSGAELSPTSLFPPRIPFEIARFKLLSHSGQKRTLKGESMERLLNDAMRVHTFWVVTYFSASAFAFGVTHTVYQIHIVAGL